MSGEQSLGFGPRSKNPEAERKRLQLYINLKLASTGRPVSRAGDDEFMSIAQDLLKSYREKNRLLSSYLCPVDRRIQQFLDDYLKDLGDSECTRLPSNSLVLDRYGVARELSLPSNSNVFTSDIVSSYRVRQGILHNPANDRRTTQGSFHIAEGGLPIPGDKKSVPKITYARLLSHALNPPDELLTLPFTSNETKQAKLFVSLLLRPVVCPEIPGVQAQKNMEIRFFAPGNLVSNLDFVESIFGNAGNPNLAEHDAALDVDHWTGHTGCVILAPHLTQLTKRELGLPHYNEATERQKADGMCWKDPTERYNDGNAFKITARDTRGVIVTVLADNYYGYCKKEVKTQISYAANLYGLAEEEHAGGALAFPCINHGEEFGADSATRQNPERFSFTRVLEQYGELMDLRPEGYAIDKRFPDVIYVPLDIRMDLNAQTIRWENSDGAQSIRLRPGKTYIQPNGYKIEMQKHPGAPSWRLVGTEAEGVFCHKPCTVSGGGKSEISKSINDAVIYGPVFVQDFESDLDQVQAIFERDYCNRLKAEFSHEDRDPSRKVLSVDRSLGSVIKLLTPSPSNNEEYNAWLSEIPSRILSQVFIIKRFYQPEWTESWRDKFSVDVVNGKPGNALKLNGRELIASYLRVGLSKSSSWRTYKVRQDFIAAEKVQMEDDISASVVVSRSSLPNCSPRSSNKSVKLVKNCEYRLFQRPDEAIHRGFDKQTELDMSQPDNFIANFEPLMGQNLGDIVEDVVEFQLYTSPMRDLLGEAYKEGDQYVVSSANPRLISGKPSKNPRYLQVRPDLQQPVRSYIAEIGARLNRQVPIGVPIVTPVDAVLTGRRNNPPEQGIRSLAVFNPIHYQELPELFMDFICSVTGKSPSTTGAGSEGALTKGPFNALRATADLNNALVSFVITGYSGFSSAAGYIGPNLRVDHDISLLIPEIWARLEEKERDPDYLIQEGYLEKLDDFDFRGGRVLASRLGFRITDRFVAAFMGKIFDNPAVAMDEAILRPESQDLDVFVDGVKNIVEAQQQAAENYIVDGSIEDACPPLKALLHIMARGHFEGKDVHDPDIRAMFSRDYLLNSRWYLDRLKIKQEREISLWKMHEAHLQEFLSQDSHQDVAMELDIKGKLIKVKERLNYLASQEYLDSLFGTIGADALGVGH